MSTEQWPDALEEQSIKLNHGLCNKIPFPLDLDGRLSTSGTGGEGSSSHGGTEVWLCTGSSVAWG